MKRIPQKPETVLIWIFLAFTLGITLVAFGYYRKQQLAFEEAAGHQLRAMVDLKMAQLVRWREERIGDANWIVDTELVVTAVKDYLSHPLINKSRDVLLELMTAWQNQNHYYRVLLLDTNREVRLAVPAHEAWIGDIAARFLTQAFQSNQVLVSDLHISKVSHLVNMDLFVPVWEKPSPERPPAPPLAVLMFEINPHDFLFRSIQSRPIPSQTMETLLVRKEGEEVVVLNELRHQTNTALRLRFPMAQFPDLPAVRAVQGEQDVVRGVDYRRTPVLAVLRPVPNSPWFLVGKMDLKEIHAPLRKQAALIALLTGLLVLAASLGILFLWRNREFQYARKEIEEQQRAEAELRREQDRIRLLNNELALKNEELENLIYAASHDLRSPLVNIEGFGQRVDKACQELTQLVESSEWPPALRQQTLSLTQDRIPKALNYIHSGVAKMNGLISGMLQLSRLGRVALKPQTIDMDQLLRQVLQAMAFQIQKASAQVKIDPLPPCHGDAMLINQVFSNLLDNALKYRDPSRPLHLSISGQVENGQSIYAVADTGLGIAPQVQTKIWDLFYRHTTDPQVKGEGLGLNLAKRIVARHHGRIWVESTPGQGSRFFVALPRENPGDFANPSPAFLC